MYTEEERLKQETRKASCQLFCCRSLQSTCVLWSPANPKRRRMRHGLVCPANEALNKVQTQIRILFIVKSVRMSAV